MRYWKLILPLISACLFACDDGASTRHANNEAAAAPANAKPIAESATTAPSNSPKPVSIANTRQKPNSASDDMSPAEMFRAYCTACHSLEVVETQHLDRKTWEWVMHDVVNEWGGTWITPKEQAILIEYLVANYGPEK